MPDLPVYGTRAAREVQEPARPVPGSAAASALAGRDRQARVLEVRRRGDRGLQQVHRRVRQNPEDVMPWKVLGQKWHFARKGFPPGKPPQWDVDVLEELCELLAEAAPAGQFLWNNQQVVHVFVPEQQRAVGHDPHQAAGRRSTWC